MGVSAHGNFVLQVHDSPLETDRRHFCTLSVLAWSFNKTSHPFGHWKEMILAGRAKEETWEWQGSLLTKKPRKSNRDKGLFESPRGTPHQRSSLLQYGYCRPIGTFTHRLVRACCVQRNKADDAQHSRWGGCFLQGCMRGREIWRESWVSHKKLLARGNYSFLISQSF